MIRPIVRDTIFLAQKSEPATEKDIQVVFDLVDTLWAAQIIQHEIDHCNGILI